MKAQAVICTLIFIASLYACSRDYTPAADATGEKIFQDACAECHKADNKNAPGMIFSLDPANATLAYLKQKIRNSSRKMPKFPNINDSDMQKLTDYILTHNLKR